jgi:hypothetical protein
MYELSPPHDDENAPFHDSSDYLKIISLLFYFRNVWISASLRVRIVQK